MTAEEGGQEEDNDRDGPWPINYHLRRCLVGRRPGRCPRAPGPAYPIAFSENLPNLYIFLS
jgi:hypothetical protein